MYILYYIRICATLQQYLPTYVRMYVHTVICTYSSTHCMYYAPHYETTYTLRNPVYQLKHTNIKFDITTIDMCTGILQEPVEIKSYITQYEVSSTYYIYTCILSCINKKSTPSKKKRNSSSSIPSSSSSSSSSSEENENNPIIIHEVSIYARDKEIISTICHQFLLFPSISIKFLSISILSINSTNSINFHQCYQFLSIIINLHVLNNRFTLQATRKHPQPIIN